MEKIYKRINLGEYYNRYSDTYPVGDTGIADDIVIANDNAMFMPDAKPDKYRNTLPLIPATYNGDSYYILRFKNMTRQYAFLRRFLLESALYRCTNKDGVRKLSYLGSGGILLKSFTGDNTNIDWEEVVDVITKTEVPYYNFSGITGCLYILASDSKDRFFSTFGYREEGSPLLSTAAEYYLYVRDTLSGGTIDSNTPYIEIPLYIGETVKDLGMLTAAIQNWIPGKEYVTGETVYYYVDENQTEIGCFKLMGGDGFVYNSETHKIEFPYYDGTNGWQLLEGEAYTPTGETGQSIIVESRLMTLKRKKVSYDDNGNALPFIYNYFNDGNNSGYTVELLFSIGTKQNISYLEDGSVQYDIVDNITIINNDTIRFEYTIGKIDDATGGTVSLGATYVETYPCVTNASMTFTYNGVETSVTYTAITFETQIRVDTLNPDKLYSELVNFERYDNGVQIPYFKDERYLGMHDITRDTDSYYIERGTSSAFERHNILGECSSMDDLEKYRNDFFSVKKQ